MGLELPEETVFDFRNPWAGLPQMQADPTAEIELPDGIRARRARERSGLAQYRLPVPGRLGPAGYPTGRSSVTIYTVTGTYRAREALVALAGLAAGLGALWLVHNRSFGPDELNSPQSWLLGWSFIGSGLIALRVRPQNRLGWAMVFTGFAWFASLLMLAHDSPLFTIGAAMQVVYIAGFAYVVVSFPSGSSRAGLSGR